MQEKLVSEVINDNSVVKGKMYCDDDGEPVKRVDRVYFNNKLGIKHKFAFVEFNDKTITHVGSNETMVIEEDKCYIKKV